MTKKESTKAKKGKAGGDNVSSGIDSTLKEIQEKFGEGAIMRLGESKRVDIDAIPTGALSLDMALGIGGIPQGRIVEMFGPESSGKTTVALHIAAEAQKIGKAVAYIDAEHAMDPDYARRIGVNTDDLLISQPDTGEEALEIAEALIRTNGVGLIVIDSVAALTPKAEIEGRMEDQQVGLQARLMSKALRKLTSVAFNSDTALIFINQTRMKIGIMFGNPETTPGGKALKFYASVRIRLAQSAKIQKDGDIVGNRVKVKIVKNKVAPPFKETEFDILYNQGVDKIADLVKVGENYGIIARKGAWYNYNEIKLGQGIEGVRTFFKENQKQYSVIKKEIIAASHKKADE